MPDGDLAAADVVTGKSAQAFPVICVSVHVATTVVPVPSPRGSAYSLYCVGKDAVDMSHAECDAPSKNPTLNWLMVLATEKLTVTDVPESVCRFWPAMHSILPSVVLGVGKYEYTGAAAAMAGVDATRSSAPRHVATTVDAAAAVSRVVRRETDPRDTAMRRTTSVNEPDRWCRADGRRWALELASLANLGPLGGEPATVGLKTGCGTRLLGCTVTGSSALWALRGECGVTGAAGVGTDCVDSLSSQLRFRTAGARDYAASGP